MAYLRTTVTHFQILILSAVLIILILFAAFFAGAETGLMAVNRYRLRHKARLKKRYAIHLLRLLKRPDRVLGAILIGSTFASMLASSLATMLALHFFGEEGAFLAAIFLALIVLIFAEITPKTLAAIYPDQVARFVTYPIRYILFVLYPVVRFTNAISNTLLRCFRINVTSQTLEPLSREELRSVVYDTAGKISRSYQNMLLSILDLNKLTVDDVMIPRNEIGGIDIESPWKQILEKIAQFHQEWVPFYRENINQVIGVLYAHDLLSILPKMDEFNRELLQQLLQEPYFVPEGTSLYTQLGYFQKSQIKIAFIVDEYGEIQGMLTINDILEEIVGDFTPGITAGERIQHQPNGSYLVQGAVTVREFNRLSGWELPLRGPRTVNGLIIEHLEALPHIGTAVLIGGYPIEIMQVKENRVKLANIFPRLKSGNGLTND